MGNLNAILNEQIRRLARREIRANVRVTKKATTAHRRDIAALKRTIASLAKRIALVEKKHPKDFVAPAEVMEKARFRADGLRSHRARLGISAEAYGKLIGASALTIYNWESGKAKPRAGMLAKLVAIRGLGKREALQRLGEAGEPAGGRRKRGVFAETGEAMILRLAKGKGITTKQAREAWEKAGRGGAADNTLSRMVKTGTLKRIEVAGERGSKYVARA